MRYDNWLLLSSYRYRDDTLGYDVHLLLPQLRQLQVEHARALAVVERLVRRGREQGSELQRRERLYAELWAANAEAQAELRAIQSHLRTVAANPQHGCGCGCAGQRQRQVQGQGQAELGVSTHTLAHTGLVRSFLTNGNGLG